jgi:ketosteroid isomerase-like protein/quercetin dioxygenase-like cupin family protein
VATACAPTVNVEEARAALIAADTDWSQTTKEPDKFVAFFADNASIYAPGMPIVTGTEAIRKAYKEMSSAPGFSLSWVPNKGEVSASGDLGYTTGTYEMGMGGVIEKGKYVTAWKKQADGAWKVTEDIFNADEAPKSTAATHVAVPADSLKWGDAPPGMPGGMRAAVVSGDPAQAGQPYVLRAQMPAGYRIPPHWHPTNENVTVLSGTVALGMGDTFDERALQDLSAGSFTTVPADMRHFFVSKTASTIQVHGIAPFGITYVNPADDPRMKK